MSAEEWRLHQKVIDDLFRISDGSQPDGRVLHYAQGIACRRGHPNPRDVAEQASNNVLLEVYKKSPTALPHDGFGEAGSQEPVPGLLWKFIMIVVRQQVSHVIREERRGAPPAHQWWRWQLLPTSTARRRSQSASDHTDGTTIDWSGKASIRAWWEGGYLRATVDGWLAASPSDATLSITWMRTGQVYTLSEASTPDVTALTLEPENHRPPESGDQLHVSRLRSLRRDSEGWQATVTFGDPSPTRVQFDVKQHDRIDWYLSEQEVEAIVSEARAQLSEDVFRPTYPAPLLG